MPQTPPARRMRENPDLDTLLQSTPLGWACRWGRVEMVKLFLARGADPVEADAEPWATPRAWAHKMGRTEILELLPGP